MEHITKSILNYVNSSSVYGMMLNGAWGSGKTFFIKEVIIKELEEINKGDKEKYYSIYVSLYGCDSLLDVKKKINISILKIDGLRKKMSQMNSLERIGNMFSNIFSSNKYVKSGALVIEELIEISDEKKLKKMKNKVILFIDDLERLSSKIEINDLFGLISSLYLENLGAKVVFISNINEINNIDIYENTKEKIIDKTVLFNPSTEYSISNIAKFSDNRFIIDNKKWILEIFDFFNDSLNLRTLQSIFYNFEYFDMLLSSKVDKMHKHKLQKSLFLNVMVITSFVKESSGNEVLTEQDANNWSYDSNYISSLNSYDLESLNKEDKIGKKNQGRNDLIVLNKINAKYHGKNEEFDNYIFYFNGITDFVLHGFYDETIFNDSYSKWKSLFYPSQNMDDFSILSNFDKLNDVEFKKRQDAIIKSVENDKYSFEELIDIYRKFISLEKVDLILTKKDYDQLLVNKISSNYVNVSRKEVEKVELFFLDSEQNERTKLLKDSLQDIEIERFKNEYRKELIYLLEDKQIDYSSRRGNEVIFCLLSEEDFLDKYILCDNSRALKIVYYISQQVFSKENINHKAVDEIIRKLEKTNNLGKIDNYKISQLARVINKSTSSLTASTFKNSL
ncbi:P-loop NTPase fold protein [Enterococcus entomosocium]|uniref:P-loop NTPase fold protein n=1 Tax=Enterococcus entomosocium TaxID=3034352 RepID=UPI003D6B8B96